MDLRVPSFLDNTYTILDNKSIIRNPKNLNQSDRYNEGDHLPEGKKIGDQKILPLMTEIAVTDVQWDERRNLYVYAKAAEENPDIPEGWTRVTNLGTLFCNELLRYAPAEWVLEPGQKNYTVTDPKSLIRHPETYRSTGEIIAPGTFVVVTASSSDTDPKGKYVRVSEGVIEDGKPKAINPIGWTAASNLHEGWSDVYNTNAWKDQTGNNATWKSGRYTGQKVLVSICGTGGQVQHVALDTLHAYFKLITAAAKSNLQITINSAFRTYGKQKALYDRYKAGNGNLAAKPGRSNHQNGIAFDLNTLGFQTSVYKWMKKNATKYGFIRTVNKEHWHWEYRPADAERLRAEGKFALDRVTT